MFILSETDRRLINVDQVRSFEIERGNVRYIWELVAVFDVPGYGYRLAQFDSDQGEEYNRNKAMALLKNLCKVMANTEDHNTVIDIATIGDTGHD